MGGHVSVGVRRADGSFRTIGVWTNPLGYFMLEAPFRVEGSLEPLDRFFARYLGEDAEGSGFGLQDSVPGEYGYVLVDEIEKTITSMNDYAAPDWVTQDDIGFSPVFRRYLTQDVPENMAVLRKNAYEVRYVSPKERGHVYESLPPFTTHEALYEILNEISLKECEEEEPLDPSADFRHRSYLSVRIAFPAWTIVNLRANRDGGAARMFEALSKVTSLSEPERKAWQALLKKSPVRQLSDATSLGDK